MIRRPPRSTRTDTLFPYTTLFRSIIVEVLMIGADRKGGRAFRLAEGQVDRLAGFLAERRGAEFIGVRGEMDAARIKRLHIGRALRPRERQRERIVTADVPDRRARDREGLVADFAVQRRLDPLPFLPRREFEADGAGRERLHQEQCGIARLAYRQERLRSEEHTSELQSLMRISYAVF